MKDLKELKRTPGSVLRAFRRNFEIPQKEICEYLGITQGNLSAIENGRASLGLEMATRFALLFNLDPLNILSPNGIENDFKDYEKIKKTSLELAEKIGAAS